MKILEVFHLQMLVVMMRMLMRCWWKQFFRVTVL